MSKRASTLVYAFLILALAPSGYVQARAIDGRVQPQTQPTPAELIDAVNSLRLAYGLAPLGMHPILMQTAQGQANALLASDGAVGHTRPGGITYTQQLLMLGYPLAGDLSLGGFRAENFVFGNGLTPLAAVELWRGDEPHTNTMLSPNYMDIGAGVAIGEDGTIYYVIDCARPTSSGQPQDEALVMLTSTVSAPADALSQYILPVQRSTARPDGDVLHRVQYGQSLWSIAIAYGTTINNIRALNNLDDTTVYEGQILLIQKGATQPSPPTTTPARLPSQTPAAAQPTSTPTTLSQLPTGATDQINAEDGSFLPVLLGILIFVIVVGGGTAVWFIRTPEETPTRAGNRKA